MRNSATPTMFSFTRVVLLPTLLSAAVVLCLLEPQALAQSVWTHKGVRARYGQSAVFDPGSRRLIVFAGQHTTTYGDLNDAFWDAYMAGSPELIWNPVAFVGSSPASRFGHSAVYDSANARMTVFGGGYGSTTPAPCQNDVWILQNASGVNGKPAWTQQFPLGTAPAPRFSHTAVYDPGTNRMIVFG